jgi:acetylornithine deacetylase/succinyl-diaminopimelate desuccinylase-like protein
VPNQDPAKVAEAIATHVKRVTPPGVTVNVTRPGFTADAYLMPADHWGNRATSEVLVEMYGREPYYIRTGGSIPVCTLFKKQLGAYTVNFAFGLDDERAHSPDEFFRLSSFRQGQDGYCVLLHRLAQETVPSK